MKVGLLDYQPDSLLRLAHHFSIFHITHLQNTEERNISVIFTKIFSMLVIHRNLAKPDTIEYK